MSKTTKKSLGHVSSLALGLSGALQTEAMVIDLGKLNIFVGANGVGKSLVMKLTWVMQMITQLIIAKVPQAEQAAQYILDHSVPENGMIGHMILVYESGAMVNVNLLEGQINSLQYRDLEEITEPSSCIYMSSEMRTFNDIKQYLTVRKLVGMEKMDQHYKLYDIMYVEKLIQRCPVTLDPLSKETLGLLGCENLTSIEFTGDDFVGVFGQEKKSLAYLGAGEQSMINMMAGGLL